MLQVLVNLLLLIFPSRFFQQFLSVDYNISTVSILSYPRYLIFKKISGIYFGNLEKFREKRLGKFTFFINLNLLAFTSVS